MIAGTKVVEIGVGANSIALFSKSELESMLGLTSGTFNATNFGISILNGDGAAFPSHLECPTYTNNNIYVVWKDTLKAKMNCRVNYVMFYLG